MLNERKLQEYLGGYFWISGIRRICGRIDGVLIYGSSLKIRSSEILIGITDTDPVAWEKLLIPTGCKRVIRLRTNDLIQDSVPVKGAGMSFGRTRANIRVITVRLHYPGIFPAWYPQ